jgi:Sulfotransferase domain
MIGKAAPLLFEFQYQLQRRIQQGRFRQLRPPAGGWPVLLGISFPKSGTNLLRQVLAGFADDYPFADRSFEVFAAFDARTGTPRAEEDALRFLHDLRDGDIAAAHLHTWPGVLAEVGTPRYIPYFIYRDPRDVVVSHVFYVTDRSEDHVHHQYYTRELSTFEERLRTSIQGRPDSPTPFPDIRARYEPYLGWLDHPEVLCLPFESFVLDREAALGRVLDHFEARIELARPRPDMLKQLSASINPEKSPTFRSGHVGDWKQYFSEENTLLFKQVSGDLLIRLGYETDDQG